MADTGRGGGDLVQAKFGMAKCGTTKLYHILPWYLRTEAICLGVVVVQPATESTLCHEPQVWLWRLGITSKSPEFETWLHSENVAAALTLGGHN